MSRWLPLLLGLGACASPDASEELVGTWVGDMRYEYLPDCFGTVHSRITLASDGAFQWYWEAVQGIEDGEIVCFYFEPERLVELAEGEWTVIDIGDRHMLSVAQHRDRRTEERLVDEFDPASGWRFHDQQWDDTDKLVERTIRWGEAPGGERWLWVNQTGLHLRVDDEGQED